MKITKFFSPVLGVVALLAIVSSAMAQDSTKKGGAAAAGDAAKGKEVFEQCAVCHNADNEEKKMGPGLKGLFKRQTEPVVRKKIDEGGNGMPAYAEMLERNEKHDLIAYLKTL